MNNFYNNYKDIFYEKFKLELTSGEAVPWILFENFIGHLTDCKSCESCYYWCEYCKKDVQISKLTRHQ